MGKRSLTGSKSNQQTKLGVCSLSEADFRKSYVQRPLNAHSCLSVDSKPIHRNCQIRYELLHLMLLAYSDQYFFLRCNLRRKNINWRQAKPVTTNKATPIIALPLNNRPNNAAPKTPIKIMLASMPRGWALLAWPTINSSSCLLGFILLFMLPDSF